MTQTLDSPPQTPQQRAERWLSGFEEALPARDIAAAEDEANRIVWEDRPVTISFAD